MTSPSTTPPIRDASPAAAAADRLALAELTRVPCAPVRDLIGPDDVELAYAAQWLRTEARLADGARVVGRKIGITSPAVQRQLGVDRPDFGVLFDDMNVSEMAMIPSGRLLQPKIEAEVAFVLAADLTEGPLDAAQVRNAVDYAVAALEIVDSRIANWDITFGDTVADNASSGLFVLGTRRLSLSEVEPVDIAMTMRLDGGIASQGSGAACLGDPLNALAWLARTAADLGDPLRAGQVVLSGALGPMIPTPPGTRISADLGLLGLVNATFSQKDQL